MKVLLIDLPEQFGRYASPSELFKEHPCFCPDWDLLCLQSFIRERTGYLADYIDARLFRDLEVNLHSALEASAPFSAAMARVTAATIGQAVAVLDTVKAHYPSCASIVFGPFATQFPMRALALPRVDYAIAGDPEPVVKPLLSNLGRPRYIPRIEGLAVRGQQTAPTPKFVRDLSELKTPEIDEVFWPAYTPADGSPNCELALRIARGNSPSPIDHRLPYNEEPRRLWPLDRIAALVQKTLAVGIQRVYIDEPVGAWTDAMLKQWTSALISKRNSQTWGFKCLPGMLDDYTMDRLEQAYCGFVHLLIPSTRRDVLQALSRPHTPLLVRRCMQRFKEYGIQPHVQFLLDGPDAPRSEARRVIRWLRALGYPPFHLSLHPLHPESNLFERVGEARQNSILESLDAWSRNPWLSVPPSVAWSGPEGEKRFTRMKRRIYRAVKTSPVHWCNTAYSMIRSRNWIRSFEDWMTAGAASSMTFRD